MGTKITFDGDYLVSFNSQGDESFCVSFALKKAELIESRSFISYYWNSTSNYDNSNNFELYDYDEVFNYYYAEVSFYSHYGDNIMISEIKLEFNCE